MLPLKENLAALSSGVGGHFRVRTNEIRQKINGEPRAPSGKQLFCLEPIFALAHPPTASRRPASAL